MTTARKRISGISLIETLSTLALFALIMTMLVSVSALLLPQLTRSQNQSHDVSILVGRRELIQAIENAVQNPFSRDDSTGLVGTASELGFSTVSQGDYFYGGEPLAGRVYQADDGTVFLALSGKEQTSMKAQTTVTKLSPSGAKFELAYFGYRGESAFPDWFTSWDSKDGLPSLILIKIVSSDFAYPPLTALPGRMLTEQDLHVEELNPDVNRGSYP
jgi:hypothetical protein